MDNSSDAMVVALKEMYDRYGLCAGRLVELQQWLQRTQKNGKP